MRTELDEVEVVDRRKQAEELVLGHDLADAGEAALAVGGGGDPRPLRQIARVDGAEERLVGRVGHRLLEAAQGAEERRLDLRAATELARRLGAVAAEAGDMSEHRARGRDDGERHAALLKRIAVEDRRLADRRGNGVQRPFEQPAAPGALLLGSELGVARRERDAARGHDPRRADALRDRHEVAQQRGGDPGALEFLRQR